MDSRTMSVVTYELWMLGGVNFFVEGPTNAHLSTFYLNPSKPSSFFGQSIEFNIILPEKVTPKSVPSIPAGINSPKTFIEVGKYLLTIAIAEINHGINPVFTIWAIYNPTWQGSRPSELVARISNRKECSVYCHFHVKCYADSKSFSRHVSRYHD